MSVTPFISCLRGPYHSKERTDIVSYGRMDLGSDGKKLPGAKITYGTVSSTWNELGKYPIVSTLSGCCRALLGVIHTIRHLIGALWDAIASCCSKDEKDNNDPLLRWGEITHLDEARIGAFNVGLGLLEAIPVIGNLAAYVINTSRQTACEDASKKCMIADEERGNLHHFEGHMRIPSWYGSSTVRWAGFYYKHLIIYKVSKKDEIPAKPTFSWMTTQ